MICCASARARPLLTLPLEQTLRLLALAFGLVECILDPLLARSRVPEDRRVRELVQQGHEREEDDECPERDIRAQLKNARRWFRPPFSRVL
jgi:hypothetical protein